MIAPKITGILLAGGKSSRMGREKGNILVGKKYLYQYPLAVLESLCDEILISTCKEMKTEKEYEQVCDEIPNIGPMGGIYSCLKKSSNEINIVLSYDLPYANEGLFMELLKHTESADLILPAFPEDRLQPLCGIYKKITTNVLQNRIDQKIYAMHKITPYINTEVVIIEENMPFFHPNLFMNINDQSDLSQLASELS